MEIVDTDKWLEPPEYENPTCPVCGDECETLYDNGFEIVGCDVCLKQIDAYEYAEERKLSVREEKGRF